jgi:hypothetical protein
LGHALTFFLYKLSAYNRPTTVEDRISWGWEYEFQKCTFFSNHKNYFPDNFPKLFRGLWVFG